LASSSNKVYTQQVRGKVYTYRKNKEGKVTDFKESTAKPGSATLPEKETLVISRRSSGGGTTSGVYKVEGKDQRATLQREISTTERYESPVRETPKEEIKTSSQKLITRSQIKQDNRDPLEIEKELEKREEKDFKSKLASRIEEDTSKKDIIERIRSVGYKAEDEKSKTRESDILKRQKLGIIALGSGFASGLLTPIVRPRETIGGFYSLITNPVESVKEIGTAFTQRPTQVIGEFAGGSLLAKGVSKGVSKVSGVVEPKIETSVVESGQKAVTKTIELDQGGTLQVSKSKGVIKSGNRKFVVEGKKVGRVEQVQDGVSVGKGKIELKVTEVSKKTVSKKPTIRVIGETRGISKDVGKGTSVGIELTKSVSENPSGKGYVGTALKEGRVTQKGPFFNSDSNTVSVISKVDDVKLSKPTTKFESVEIISEGEVQSVGLSRTRKIIDVGKKKAFETDELRKGGSKDVSEFLKLSEVIKKEIKKPSSSDVGGGTKQVQTQSPVTTNILDVGEVVVKGILESEQKGRGVVSSSLKKSSVSAELLSVSPRPKPVSNIENPSVVNVKQSSVNKIIPAKSESGFEKGSEVSVKSVVVDQKVDLSKDIGSNVKSVSRTGSKTSSRKKSSFKEPPLKEPPLRKTVTSQFNEEASIPLSKTVPLSGVSSKRKVKSVQPSVVVRSITGGKPTPSSKGFNGGNPLLLFGEDYIIRNKKRKKKVSSVKSKKKYAPSFDALVFGITSKRKKKGFLGTMYYSGQGTRPILLR